MAVHPSSPAGRQYELVAAAPGRRVRAVINETGAALRQLSVDDVELTPSYADDVPPPFFCGAVLAPWPNRVRDGRWTHEGRPLQLEITEPELGNALHGLLYDTPYRPIERTPASIRLGAQVSAQPGYPFRLDTEVTYALTADGLAVNHRLHNAGADCTPVALGAHPFLAVGEVPAEQLIVTVSAGRHIDVDSRQIPVGSTAVAGTDWDLRAGRPVSALRLDDTWTDLMMTGAGSTHTLTAPDGRAVSLWADRQFGYVHVFITREFPCDSDHLITAVAIEPMTAPANALNSGAGLRWLAPGDSWSMSWAIRYHERHVDGTGALRAPRRP
ncbi:aldose epimerase [Mycolicibacterium litorale]|nr:aldose epimerase [Mycolicibacterium litorale]